jgi:hypothetical protein
VVGAHFSGKKDFPDYVICESVLFLFLCLFCSVSVSVFVFVSILVNLRRCSSTFATFFSTNVRRTCIEVYFHINCTVRNKLKTCCILIK